MPIRAACSAATVAVGVVLVLSACSDVSADGATKAVEAFTAAQDDPSARCALLAPGTVSALVQDEGSCEDAIGQLPVGSGTLLSVEVWGEEAQAKLSDDTLFLTHTSDGWRVSAAACQAQGAELPYDCRVEA